MTSPICQVPKPSAHAIRRGPFLAVLRWVGVAGVCAGATLGAEAQTSALPGLVRQESTVRIRHEQERRVSGVGDFWVLAVDRAPGGRPIGEPFQRWVRLNGRLYRAAVRGWRLGETSKRNIPLSGVAVGNVLRLDTRVLRELGPGEAERLAKPAIDLSGRRERIVGPRSPVLAEMGGQAYRFASRAQLELAEQRLEAAELTLGPEPAEPAARILAGRRWAEGTAGGRRPRSSSPWTTGRKKILIIRVDFSDMPGDPKGRDGTVYTAGYVQQAADTVISPNFAESSYGLVSLTNTVTAVYRMPETASSYATNNANDQLHTDAETAAAQDYDLPSYDRWVVLFSPLDGLRGSELQYGGLAYVGTRYVWLNGEFDFRSMAHELGHTFGLYHADLWLVNDGNPVSAAGVEVDAGDVFDTMGDNFANDRRTDFNPWFKELLGWIGEGQIETVTSRGAYRVTAFDTGTTNGMLAYKVARDRFRDYWIGIRRRFTDNASLEHGAYVIWGHPESRESDLLDLTTPGTDVRDAALGIGQTLRDPAGGVTIRPLAEGGQAPGEYLDVGILLAPRITAVPTNQTVLWGQPAVFTLQATSDAVPAYQWQRRAVGTIDWTNLVDDANYWGSTTPTLTVSNTSAAMDGDSFQCLVSNAYGAMSSSPPAVLTVKGTAPRIIASPASRSALWGQEAVFRVAAVAGPPPSFQWKRQPVGSPSGPWAWPDVTDGVTFSGSTTPTLSVLAGSTGVSDGDQFECVVSNSFGRAVSWPATLYFSMNVRLMVRTLAGQPEHQGNDDGMGTNALFDTPLGIAVDSAGVIYVADTYNDTLRRISPGGLVTTLAGLAGAAGSADGWGSQARFDAPAGLAVDAAGALYVADSGNDTIRKVTPTGLVTTLAGQAGQAGSANGRGAEARFNTPFGLAVDMAGNVYVADTGNNSIRKLAPDRTVSTVSGWPGMAGHADGWVGRALFNAPTGVAVDGVGDLYVADSQNDSIRRIAPDGTVTTWTPVMQGADPELSMPFGVAVGTGGDVYVTDMGHESLWQITPQRVPTVLAGHSRFAGSADGLGARALFRNPSGVAVDQTGTVYVADAGNNTIRVGRIVSLSPPTVRIQADGRSAVLAWSALGHTFVPESTTGLGPGATWSPVTNVETIVGTDLMLTDTPGGPARFYRLRQP